MMDAIHNIVVNGIIDVQESSNEMLAMPGESPLMDVPGSFPAGVVTVDNAAKNVTLSSTTTSTWCSSRPPWAASRSR